MEVSLSTMVLVPAIAVVAPLLVRGIGRWLAIPLVVFEIVLGLLLGPAVLGWVVPDEFLDLLSEFGLAMLFFLAGNEIDFRTIRGRPLNRAAIGWIISLAAGFGIAAIVAVDLPAAAFIGIALTSTALGTILPVLRDSGDLRTPFGISVIALGAVGEFGPLLAISLFLSGRAPLVAAIVLVLFAVIAGVAIWLAAKGLGKRMHRVITATLHTSGQFAVRLVLFVLLALVALSIVLDLDMLLGAFTAGVLYRLLLAGAPKARRRSGRIEARGGRLRVPRSGVLHQHRRRRSTSPRSSPTRRTIAMLPLFVVLLLVVRGLPSLLAAPPGASRRDRVATALFGATGLPIIVAVTAIGVDASELDTGTAAALVGAGMLSVLLFPLIALAIRGTRRRSRRRTVDDDVGIPTEG